MGLAELRAKLGRPGDGPLLGTWVMYVRTPGIIRMAAQAGLDLVFLDLQHSAFGWQTVADMCELARAAGIAAVVRPHVLDAGTVNRVQDLGAAGIMFPGVEGRGDVDRYLGWTRYPPTGRRGVTVGGPAADYRPGPLEAAAAAADEARQVTVVQIESEDGLGDLEAIVGGGGVDLVEVGRNDLAAALGVPGQLRHRRIEAAVDRTVEVCARHGVPVGLSAATHDEGRALVDRGVACVVWRTDKAILADSYRGFVGSVGGGPGR